MPAAWQADRWEASFLLVPICGAWPGMLAASARVCCCRGDIIDTSSAAGLPPLQFGRKTSAGRLREPKQGMRLTHVDR